jgi:hypothetical protein
MLDGVVIDEANVFNDKLREWEDFYNYHRPPGLAANHSNDRIERSDGCRGEASGCRAHVAPATVVA